MRRLLIVLLSLGLVAFVIGCGDNTTTTTSTAAAVSETTLAETPTTADTLPSTGTTTDGSGLLGAFTEPLVVPMTGAESVPPVTTEAGGQTTFTFDPTTATVRYTIQVSGLSDATAAHIHAGKVGESGPVVVPLFGGPQKSGPFTGMLAEGQIDPTMLQGELQGKGVQDLMALFMEGGLYVNVHTVANPDGEIRGQITVPPGAGAGTGTTETTGN